MPLRRRSRCAGSKKRSCKSKSRCTWKKSKGCRTKKSYGRKSYRRSPCRRRKSRRCRTSCSPCSPVMKAVNDILGKL